MRSPMNRTWPTPSMRFDVLFDLVVDDLGGLAQVAFRGDDDVDHRRGVGGRSSRSPAGRRPWEAARTMLATLSRTSWAATSGSFSSTKVTNTWETPSAESDRSSSMPLTVLTASSMRRVTCGLDLFRGRAPQRGGDRDDREFDLGEQVDAQLAVGVEAHYDQRQDEHGGEDGPADAESAPVFAWTTSAPRRRPARHPPTCRAC